MPGKPNAVVLLSGGVDSATTLAIAKDLGFEVYALTFRYGQRHEAEIAGARRVAAALGAARHETLTFDLRTFGGSALTDDIAVPKGRAPEEMTKEIPVTYVPARNTIFLAFALAWAETLAARDIFIGATAIDFAGYPDCRPEYIEAFQRMANLATKASVEGRQADDPRAADPPAESRDHPEGARARRGLRAHRVVLRRLARGRVRTVRRLHPASQGLRRSRGHRPDRLPLTGHASPATRSSGSRAALRRAPARGPGRARRRARGSSRRCGTGRPCPAGT